MRPPAMPVKKTWRGESAAAARATGAAAPSAPGPDSCRATVHLVCLPTNVPGVKMLPETSCSVNGS
ncbi:hypothetical protein ACH4TV_45220 [Streptomyces sp. NPDC020898]|uniref:hypothetical protein n=1 Tax=Streptomyces sp. NPDC020898 TaxID=3365101 RepID=UPI00379EA2FC